MPDFEQYSPAVRNPYPETWRTVSDFEFRSHLYIARAKEAIPNGGGRETQYIVSAEYTCACRVDGEPWEITVPSGMLTDLASVPRAARWLVGRVGPHLEAAIVHDYLFVAWQEIEGKAAREEDFRFANAVMLAGMRAGGVNGILRNLIFLAVSTWIARRTYDDENPQPRFVRVPSPEEPWASAAI